MQEKSWRDDAACRGFPVDMFFGETTTAQAEAKSICSTCAVSHDCLAFALTINTMFGVFGGKTYKERQGIAKQMHKIVNEVASNA